MIARTWGKISARILDSQYVITPSGRAYEDLIPEMVVITNIEDGSFEGSIRPSSEKLIHSAAYWFRPKVDFVIHTHQNYASALLILKDHPLPDIALFGKNYERILGEKVPFASYGPNGSQALCEHVSDAIIRCSVSRAMLLANHGTECMGRDYDDAFLIAYKLEEVSKQRYLSLLSGSDLLPDRKEIEALDQAQGNLGNWYTFLSRDDLGAYFAAISSAPFTRAASCIKDNELFPYIDDLAQIAGISIRILPLDAETKQMEWALSDRNAALLRRQGAILRGSSKEDVEAAGLVLEKGCLAAILAHHLGNVSPLSKEHAKMDQESYVLSYSKLKDAKS